jgi:hypothetical protein
MTSSLTFYQSDQPFGTSTLCGLTHAWYPNIECRVWDEYLARLSVWGNTLMERCLQGPPSLSIPESRIPI